MFCLSFVRLFANIISVSLALSPHTEAEAIEGLQTGLSMMGHDFLSLPGRSLQECYNECQTRSMCFSFNHCHSGQWCELNDVSEDEEPGSIGDRPGCVFSDRTNWSKTLLNPCASHETYQPNNEGHICSVTECSDPEPIGISRILGNRKSVGSTVKYMCYRSGKLIGSHISTCLANGSWTKDYTFRCDRQASCVGEYELHANAPFKYKFCQSCETWNRAREICQEDGGDLLTLSTDEEFDYFLTLQFELGGCPYIDKMWLGASDEMEEGQWVWINGNTLSVTNKYWLPLQPDNHNMSEHCMSVWCWKQLLCRLSDDHCEGQMAFICKQS